MRYVNSANLGFNHLEIFLNAAESGSFTATAQKLNYTQSMISKTIASLENELGLILFQRKKNSVSLTPAGQSLFDDWKKIAVQIEESLEKAHTIQTGKLSALTIGAIDSSTMNEEVENAVVEFTRRHPNVTVNYDEFTLGEILNQAAKRRLDIIVTALHDAPSLVECGYEYKMLYETTLAVFVPRSNPLAEKDSLTMGDIKAESFIVLSPAQNPNFMDLLLGLCSEEGFIPKISTYVSSPHSYRINILKGEGIVLADTGTAIIHDGIKQIPLLGHKAGVIISWPKSPDNPNIERFISIASEIQHSKQ